MTPKLTGCLLGLTLVCSGCATPSAPAPMQAERSRSPSPMIAGVNGVSAAPAWSRQESQTDNPGDRGPESGSLVQTVAATVAEGEERAESRQRPGVIVATADRPTPPGSPADGPDATADGVRPEGFDGAGYQLSLGHVLQLADEQDPNVAAARERIQEAYARVDQAEGLWLPSLRAGLNYNHHEGAIQDVAGRVFNTTRSSFYGGVGANAVGASSPAVPGVLAQFHLADAIFQPKIAAHRAAARQYGATATRNDTLRDAAVGYLELLRAEHLRAIAREAVGLTERLVDLTRQYAETGQGLQSDQRRC